MAPTPLLRSALEPALAGVAELRSVPFPDESFDRAVEQARDDLVVVDLTYLDAAIVRPLITRRFADSAAEVVFVATGGETGVDDLVARAAGRPLRLVEP